ncbi:hypothetical protein HMP0015_2925 [Acinetobacter haemolyticus ATCC 19194]|uniref:Uncharacterized protein n=1 Tax=Acinetobacter haemolyticus ATCC 19194 TaxID=707232 RepID=D4XT83_ACIHA|nr:hypothetical protein HMP0015_2925 [Acinetobacter haemolyticus ATCC 19194]
MKQIDSYDHPCIFSILDTMKQITSPHRQIQITMKTCRCNPLK